MSGRDRWRRWRTCSTHRTVQEWRARRAISATRPVQLVITSYHLCRLICVSFISSFSASLLPSHYIQLLQAIHPARMLYYLHTAPKLGALVDADDWLCSYFGKFANFTVGNFFGSFLCVRTTWGCTVKTHQFQFDFSLRSLLLATVSQMGKLIERCENNIFCG